MTAETRADPSADHVPGPGFVEVAGGVIAAVGTGMRGADVALADGYLLPGLIDLQVNGYYGVEFQIADAESWARVTARLPETGTTACLPTMITAPVSSLAEALQTAATFVPDLPASGARVLGVHTEGPFIAPARRGAHNEKWITDPTPSAVEELTEAGRGLLRLVTIAPELPGALAAIEQLSAAGVLVSVGHSDATAGQVAAAAERGARMVTHLFNAQRPLGHREPGVVGQALTDERLTSGLIADLHHVVQAVCSLAFRAAPGRIALVTDAVAAAGMPPGEYLLGGELITLPPGDGAPPVRADGTLAGSALRMDRAVANAVRCGLSLPAAVAAATRIPADLIGRPDLGRLRPGAAADLVWLSPELRTRATWIAGRLVYTDGAAGTLAAVAA
ncbi:MAG TPA: N-acetylglucosamine-6-phosphate deacetylase [Streptosporangiaceae bacterium]|nr:N-acetylglucosamine-6-phosphate deacetylase [Streptosporangiaceae bacterium]